MKFAALNKNDRLVLKALDRAPKPLSAYDILDRARSEALKAPVQVYRALHKLESRGLVHRIEVLNAFVACSEHGETCGEGEHRHAAHRPGFVICRDCGTVREFEDKRVEAIAADAAGDGFAIELIALEVHGRCAGCLGGASGGGAQASE